MHGTRCFIATLAILSLLLICAYGSGDLNYVLPKCLRRRPDTFVGSMARTPGMSGCLEATNDPSNPFNRCGYV